MKQIANTLSFPGQFVQGNFNSSDRMNSCISEISLMRSLDADCSANESFSSKAIINNFYKSHSLQKIFLHGDSGLK